MKESYHVKTGKISREDEKPVIRKSQVTRSNVKSPSVREGRRRSDTRRSPPNPPNRYKRTESYVSPHILKREIRANSKFPVEILDEYDELLDHKNVSNFLKSNNYAELLQLSIENDSLKTTIDKFIDSMKYYDTSNDPLSLVDKIINIINILSENNHSNIGKFIRRSPSSIRLLTKAGFELEPKIFLKSVEDLKIYRPHLKKHEDIALDTLVTVVLENLRSGDSDFSYVDMYDDYTEYIFDRMLENRIKPQFDDLANCLDMEDGQVIFHELLDLNNSDDDDLFESYSKVDELYLKLADLREMGFLMTMSNYYVIPNNVIDRLFENGRSGIFYEMFNEGRHIPPYVSLKAYEEKDHKLLEFLKANDVKIHSRVKL